MRSGRFDGRVAVVTGAASGIGLAVVERLTSEGARVVAVDLGAEVEDLDPRGGAVTSLRGDVTDESVNAEMVATAVETHGRLDYAVLNAGINRKGAVDELPLDEYDLVVNVNLRSVVLGLRSAVPAMRAVGGGAIVATGSMWGFGASYGTWAYAVTKSGVHNLVRSAALDLGADGIRVNAISPGPTMTGMTRTWIEQDESGVAETLRGVALGRLGTPEEQAAAVAFLLSDDASFITGVALPVDGGVTAGVNARRRP